MVAYMCANTYTGDDDDGTTTTTTTTINNNNNNDRRDYEFGRRSRTWEELEKEEGAGVM